jgi:uncharacterized RDD family membrane protein YckC
MSAGPDLPAGIHHSIPGEVRQVVRSPDQVALHVPVAGPASRMLAYLVDVVLMVLADIAILVGLVLTSAWLRDLLARAGERMQELADPASADPAAGGIAALFFAAAILLMAGIEMGYFVAWEALTGGGSAGKLLVGLRVMRDGGLPLDLRSSVLRNLMRAVDVLPANYLVGLVAMLLSPEGKRLGDLVAGTVVVRMDRPAPAVPLPADRAEEGMSFRLERVQALRLGSAERSLARQTLRRLRSLPPARAEEALDRAVEVLRARVGYADAVPPEERVAFLRALLEAALRTH